VVQQFAEAASAALRVDVEVFDRNRRIAGTGRAKLLIGNNILPQGIMDGFTPEEKVRGNLGEIIVGTKPGRQCEKERIFFNPIGMGIHDLSEAHRVFENALRMGIGKKLALWENPILG